MHFLAELLKENVPDVHRSQVFIRGGEGGHDTPIFDVDGLGGERFNLGFVDDAYNEKHPTWRSSCRLAAVVMSPNTFQSLPDHVLPFTIPVLTPNPRLVFAYMAQPFLRERKDAASLDTTHSEIHPDACVSRSAIIGRHATIGPDVEIGDDVIVGPGAVINHARIEKDTYIGPNVCIGGPGFGFVTDEKTGNVVTMPHVGRVLIEDNVVIMAGTCIARGSLSDTMIRHHARIDQLCHIAHNCYIGERALVIAHTMLGGSTVVHYGAWVAPSTSTKEGTRIGYRAMTGLGATVIRDVPDEEIHVGNPAKFLRNRRESE